MRRSLGHQRPLTWSFRKAAISHSHLGDHSEVVKNRLDDSVQLSGAYSCPLRGGNHHRPAQPRISALITQSRNPLCGPTGFTQHLGDGPGIGLLTSIDLIDSQEDTSHRDGD